MMSDATDVKGRLVPNPTLNDAFPCPPAWCATGHQGCQERSLLVVGYWTKWPPRSLHGFQVSVTLIRASLTVVHAHLAG